MKPSQAVAGPPSLQAEHSDSTGESHMDWHEQIRVHLETSLKGRINTAETNEEIASELVNVGVPAHISQLSADRGNLFVDMGDFPLMISNTQAASAESVFVVPETVSSQVVIAEYNEYSPSFFLPVDAFDRSFLPSHHMSKKDFEDTIKDAEQMLLPLRGTVTRVHLCLLLAMSLGVALAIVISVVLGIYVTYYLTAVLLILYFVLLGIITILVKKRSVKLLLHAHIALALFAKSENNRLYSAHNVRLRPGYLAKWLEFVSTDDADYVPAANP